MFCSWKRYTGIVSNEDYRYPDNPKKGDKWKNRHGDIFIWDGSKWVYETAYKDEGA